MGMDPHVSAYHVYREDEEPGGGFGRLGWRFGPILDSSGKLDGEQLKKMCSKRKQESQDSSGWEFHPLIFSDAFSLMQRKVKTTVAKASPMERGLPNKV